MIAQRVTCPLGLKKYICDEDEMKMVISLEAKEVHKGNDDNENDDLHIMTTRGTAVRRHCTDWYKIWALTDHAIYYSKIELDLRKFSNGPFSETEKGFGVGSTPGGSQCIRVSPNLSWKWPRATLSPSFGPFFEKKHSFGVKMVSQKVLQIMPLGMISS